MPCWKTKKTMICTISSSIFSKEGFAVIDDSYRYRVEVYVYRGDALESKQIVCTDKKLEMVILKHAKESEKNEGLGIRN